MRRVLKYQQLTLFVFCIYSLTLGRQRLCARFGGLAALQAPFFSPPGAGVARAGGRKMDFWGDLVSPNPSLRKSYYSRLSRPHRAHGNDRFRAPFEQQIERGWQLQTRDLRGRQRQGLDRRRLRGGDSVRPFEQRELTQLRDGRGRQAARLHRQRQVTGVEL